MLYNPASGRGRGERAIAATRAAFARFGFTDVRATRHAGDEARLVAEALDDGVGTLVVCGGDGTWSKCAVPLARAGSPARMALLAAGTGNDFAQNLALKADDPARLAALLAGAGAGAGADAAGAGAGGSNDPKEAREGVRERRVDLGRVDDTWFLNVAGFGFDVAVLRRVHRSPRLRGAAVYLTAALRELVGYRGEPVAVDGDERERLMTVFTNGRRFGGAFQIAPDARVDDGLLDAVVIGELGTAGRVAVLARLVRGVHAGHPAVVTRRAAHFACRFREPPWFEADGELHRAAGREVEVASVPGALRVVDG